jgi:hypothetical protein
VESKSNLNRSIKRQRLGLERHLFINFSQGSHCSLNALVTALKPPPKGSGELTYCNELQDPYPACLEAVLG